MNEVGFVTTDETLTVPERLERLERALAATQKIMETHIHTDGGVVIPILVFKEATS